MYESIRVNEESSKKRIPITVNGKHYQVAEKTTIKRALESLGFEFGIFSKEGDLQSPCGFGGCYTCMVLLNGDPVRTCVTLIEKNASIETRLPEDFVPKRIIHGPQPHRVGGKATPWWLKAKGYIEVAIWAAGCNLRCPQCQNYSITYDGKSSPITPYEAAQRVTLARRNYEVDRMAISGGEPTLNKPWLVEYFKELKHLNQDEKARLHLDSNGTILTKDYIDELVLECGVTDIGIEPKGVRTETFMKITGIEDEKLVKRYQHTQWQGIRHITENYLDRVFLGVGFPYNSYFMGLDEVSEFGKKLAGINPEVQVCVLDYFPAFKRKEMKRPSVEEMMNVKKTLNETGLKTVIVQTSKGHFGP
ncbi:pyruvate formate lyase activating enzyme [Methanococcoides vulcani]|uniref:Pyruvate formate lyase activating enzyme n=1 Tax=Methanococcoides vulcani TaxID=1353158 RepID=A0A1H9Y076_9EURY|nr:radical SAM protein [Methanococcoides vulcani]SES62030.1 pyruvate formate lyase activating enzyme [Methanococcoides vulcani]